MGNDPGKSFSNKVINEDEQEVALGKQNMICLPKEKLQFKFFPSPDITYLFLLHNTLFSTFINYIY